MTFQDQEPRAGFGLRLLHLGRLWRQAVDAEIQKAAFSGAGWRALLWLQRGGEGLRQKDLAALMGIEGPSLVRLLDGLCAQGLLRREADTADRRAHRLILSEEGRAAVARIEARLAAIERDLLDGLTDAELAPCAAVLKRLEGKLQAQRSGGR
ncbi:MarR family transcriptional regulator [Roseomonas sp. E05]|uniref:MarR family winged helix-turn-helix transcriptional regulator n=1 Tax=Roseomonas sp. E05 TaxID=3046310 RepID=UPI0024BBB994|nr:MarR family transcriptional regulator [Roseomonas sp. E05]MDJ0389452.1 MarR family transcriptional regulator [Roseomonas sp. E05]